MSLPDSSVTRHISPATAPCAAARCSARVAAFPFFCADSLATSARRHLLLSLAFETWPDCLIKGTPVGIGLWQLMRECKIHWPACPVLLPSIGCQHVTRGRSQLPSMKRGDLCSTSTHCSGLGLFYAPGLRTCACSTLRTCQTTFAFWPWL